MVPFLGTVGHPQVVVKPGWANGGNLPMESSIFFGGVPIKNGRKEMGHWAVFVSPLISEVVFLLIAVFFCKTWANIFFEVEKLR